MHVLPIWLDYKTELELLNMILKSLFTKLFAALSVRVADADLCSFLKQPTLSLNLAYVIYNCKDSC